MHDTVVVQVGTETLVMSKTNAADLKRLLASIEGE